MRRTILALITFLIVLSASKAQASMEDDYARDSLAKTFVAGKCYSSFANFFMTIDQKVSAKVYAVHILRGYAPALLVTTKSEFDSEGMISIGVKYDGMAVVTYDTGFEAKVLKFVECPLPVTKISILGNHSK